MLNLMKWRRAAAIAAGASLALLAAPVLAQQQLTVVSFGGAYQDGQSKALFQPAAKALGIVVKEETYSGIADLRLKVKAGAVPWDIVASGSGSAARAGASRASGSSRRKSGWVPLANSLQLGHWPQAGAPGAAASHSQLCASLTASSS